MSAPPVALGPTRRRSGRWAVRLAGWRSFLGRLLRRPEGFVGVAIVAFFAVLAFAPGLFVGPLETVISATGKRLEPPSFAHLLGTDNVGRDVLNLTVHGARISMLIGLLATLVTLVIGALFGIVSGFVGGRTDTVIMRTTDFFLVLPTFVLALILAPIVLDIIGTGEIFRHPDDLVRHRHRHRITSWAINANIILSQTMSVKERASLTGSRHRVRAVADDASPYPAERHGAHRRERGAHLRGAILTEMMLAFIGLGDPFARPGAISSGRRRMPARRGSGRGGGTSRQAPAFLVVLAFMSHRRRPRPL